MKVDKLTANDQPSDWFDRITNECRKEYPMHLVKIEPTEVVIDAGCNVGGFSQAFGHLFHNILAIDASLYNVEQYKSRHSNEVLHKALYSKDNEIVKLRKYMAWETSDTNSGNFGITNIVDENNNGWKSAEYEEVETISLETIIEKVGDIGLLKIDIEAAEFDALYKKDLSRIKYITGEFHNTLFKFDDRGLKLFDWISQTHMELFSDGDGINSHFVKLWVRQKN